MAFQGKGGQKSAGKSGGYDKSKDKEIFAGDVEVGESRLTVSVFSYNNGTPKLQFSREVKGENGDYAFAKLGRLSKEEVKALSPLIKQAYDNM